jgi:hypothetical protein
LFLAWLTGLDEGGEKDAGGGNAHFFALFILAPFSLSFSLAIFQQTKNKKNPRKIN